MLKVIFIDESCALKLKDKNSFHNRIKGDLDMANVTVSEGIVEVAISRFITIDDVINNIQEYAEGINAVDGLQLLVIDATQCRSNISLSDLSKLKHSNNLLCERFEMLKVGIILNDPVYTALCMVYQNLLKSDRYHLKVFSTRDAAYRWLKY